MKLKLRRNDATGYQEPWETHEPPSTMPVVFVTAELESDDGKTQLTLGRLFFSPENFALMGEGVTIEGEGLDVRAA